MFFNLTTFSSEPIHMQISKQLLEKILADTYYHNRKLPPVRLLASEQHINAGSIERAYQYLEKEGLVQKRNNRDYFIPDFTPQQKQALHQKFHSQNPISCVDLFSKKLASVYDTSELYNILVTTLKNKLLIKNIFFLMIGKNGQIVFNSSRQENKVIDMVAQPSNKGFVQSIDAPAYLASIQKNDLINELIKSGFQMIFPLAANPDLQGFIAVSAKTTDAEYTDQELNLLSVLTRQFMTAVSTAEFYKEVIEKERLDEELKIAKQIQKNLLPETLPQDNAISFAAVTKSSRSVGGDFYDIFNITTNKVGIVIADACGKGLPAAMLISQIQALLRSEIKNGKSMKEVIKTLNEQLLRFTPKNKFITLLYGIIDKQRMTFEFINAGHVPPFLVRKVDQPTHLAKGGTGLGIIADIRHDIQKYRLQQGDVLFLYTDGLTEQMNDSSQQFGEKRVLSCLKSNKRQTAVFLTDAVLHDVKKFCGESELQDDCTMVAMKINQKDE